MKNLFDDGPRPYQRIIRSANDQGEDHGATFWLDCRASVREIVVWPPGALSLCRCKCWDWDWDWDEFWELCRTCPDPTLLLDWILEHSETEEQKQLAALITEHLLEPEPSK